MRTLAPSRRILRTGLRHLLASPELRGRAAGPQELWLGLPGLPTPLEGLRLADPARPRGLMGPTRLGLDTVWRTDAAHLAALDAPAPFTTRWLSLRFDLSAPPEACWRAFGRLRLWTPRLEWRPARLCLRLAEAADPGERQACRELLEKLLGRLESVEPAREDWSCAWRPLKADARTAWEALAAAALAAMAGSGPALDKLVLARSRELRLTGRPAGAELLARLAAREPRAWPWLLAWDERAEWLGATPEWLLKRRGRRLETLALAGTRPRGADAAQDRRLGMELLASEKDRREQAVVAEWIESQLEPLGLAEARWRGPALRRLGRLQHLESRLDARLPAGVGLAELMRRLHPSPALGGRPREVALAWLKEREPGDRGLYGGLLGVVEPGRSELRVAIRGALRQGDRLRLWAGAGLVPGSDPALEWEETTLKLQALASAWGAEA